MELTLSEITSLNDPIYDRWLDLYQTSFPLNEQMLVSHFNALLRARQSGETGQVPLFACLDAEGRFKALIHYEAFPELRAAVLWYFAVEPQERSQGIGSAAYDLLLRHLQTEQPAIRALFYEVEDPEVCESPEHLLNAQRRIAFYKRNGAAQLSGIHYVQSVGWQPPLQMCLLVHPYTTIEPEEAFALARQLFGDNLHRIGRLALV